MNHEAQRRRAFHEALSPGSRVLITGSTGWFGTAFIKLLPDNIPRMTLDVRRQSLESALAQARDFQPTLVANFAFVTAERASSMEEQEFRDTNAELSRVYLELSNIDSVERSMTVSSGVVNVPASRLSRKRRIYADIKRAEEAAIIQQKAPGKSWTILRAYSVSGPDVRLPHAYAMSNFVLQALSGCIEIHSNQLMYRRYVSVSDALAVSLLAPPTSSPRIIETGGDKVEIGFLAQQVADSVDSRCIVRRPSLATDMVDDYSSSDLSWRAACAQTGYYPASLQEQIQELLVQLDSSHRPSIA